MAPLAVTAVGWRNPKLLVLEDKGRIERMHHLILIVMAKENA